MRHCFTLMIQLFCHFWVVGCLYSALFCYSSVTVNLPNWTPFMWLVALKRSALFRCGGRICLLVPGRTTRNGGMQQVYGR